MIGQDGKKTRGGTCDAKALKLFERDIRSRLVAAPQRSSISHRHRKGTQRDLFGGARFSGGGDRYLTGWSGNGTPDRPGKMSSHRLARRGSKLYRASQGV